MATPLSPTQCSALLDILTHSDTYSQIQFLRSPGSLSTSGPPFTTQSTPSTTPALQKLLDKYVCKAVGLRDVPPEYWKVQIRSIMDDLQEANLSESYDKGSIGTRKTLATAIGALLEYPTRGVFGGIKRRESIDRHYDLGKAEDLERGWADFCSEVVWGNGLDDMFKRATQSDKLEDQEPMVQAMAEYMTVNIASILHYTLILSPQGQYLLGLMENAYKMVPWGIVKQTLKIGNAASMINGMMKIVLAKVSVGSLTNTLGITTGKDEGMNLNQRILASTFGGDIKDFENKAHKIEKEKVLSKIQLQCLREYTTKPREVQENIRHQSESFCISIVDSIFASQSLPTDLTPAAHKSALAYLSHHLSIRDRREIVRILCRSNPDHLTSMIRTQLDVYDPVIRRSHKAADLSAGCGDLEAFLHDLIKVAKIRIPKGSDKPLVPTVADFVQLLRKHRYSLDKFNHQLLKNDPELTGWFLEAGKQSVREFRDDSSSATNAAGKLSGPLNDLFSSVPSETREKMLGVLDGYATYLDRMNALTTSRLQKALDGANRKSKNPVLEKILKRDEKKSKEKEKTKEKEDSGDEEGEPVRPELVSNFSSMSIGKKTVQMPEMEAGPGGYLIRWRDLVERQKVTPKESERGGSGKPGLQNGGAVDRPDTSLIEEVLGAKFRQMLGVRGVDW